MKEKWNFKKMLVAISLFSLVLPTSLGTITHSAKIDVANSNIKIASNKTYASDEEIVGAINNLNYIKELRVNTTAIDLKAAINPEFIKNQLTGEIKNDFKDQLFTVNRIINQQGQEISDNDLTTTQVISAKFNYNYGAIEAQTAKLFIIINVENEQIINEINSNLYNKNLPGGSTAAELKAAITPDFIRSKLTGEIKNGFKDNLFTLTQITNEQGRVINDNDLKNVGNIYAKIHYNYNTFKNQTTNLIITINEGLLQLRDVFKNFKFQEFRGTEGFLDSNDVNNITNQIERYLGKSLATANLILENQKATSIVLKAQPNSKNYQGEVKLTWNLKLFEITGQKLLSSPDFHVYNGVKAFIYLDHQDQQVRVFDYPGYRNARTVIGYANSWWTITHRLAFFNDRGGNFQFNIYSSDLTSNLPARFGNFDFASGIQVILTTTTPPYYIGVFKKNLNKWDIAPKRNYFIDFLGNVH